jgi:hypothetical protein
MKDITFEIVYNGGNTSKITTLYGQKKILTVVVSDDDIAEFKALAFAVQLEAAKDIINQPR